MCGCYRLSTVSFQVAFQLRGFRCSATMQVVRKDFLCVVSLKNESDENAWMSSSNRLALVAQADNASQSEEISIMMYIKLLSCAPS